MIRIAFAAVLLTSAAPSFGQILATARAAEELAVRVGSSRNSIPVGQDVTAGAQLAASATSGRCTFSSFLRFTLTSGTSVSSELVAAFGTSCRGAQPPSPQFSRGSIGITLSAAQPTTGTLRAHLYGEGVLTVDIDGDGIDFSRPPSDVLYEAPLSIDGSGRLVVLEVDAASHSRIALTFEPLAGKITSIGSSCGPDLWGFYRQEQYFSTPPGVRDVTLRVSHSPHSPLAFFVFGAQTASIPIPPTGCPLSTVVLVAASATPSSRGEATLTLNIPSVIGALDVLTQFVVATDIGQGRLGWHTSQVLRVLLP